MASHIKITVCSSEIVQRVKITQQDLIDIVSHGIIRPHDMRAIEWQFDDEVVTDIARAARLRRDLQINWAGVALALELLDEVKLLRRENSALLRRLKRFEE
ncbi:MAG: chaperone modulator CbpM [Alcanivoracaceae bacterium]|nr:chaperone modulator CbpM [Alcanivoracaceae bacterium]